MVGLTLTPEQIRSAPPEVRRWLEQEVAATLGLDASQDPAILAGEHLAACTPNEALEIYVQIRDSVPVVAAFFELGREGERLGRDAVALRRLVDILQHSRLPSLDDLLACLQVIDSTFRRLRGDGRATLCAVDERGICLIAIETQQSIAAVWQKIVSRRAPPATIAANDVGHDGLQGPAARNPVAPPKISAHFDGLYPSLYDSRRRGPNAELSPGDVTGLEP